MDPIRDRNRPAFSLTELLVAIGVVAILLSILLPMLKGARGRAKATSAVASVRDLGQLVSLYSQDNKGYFPQVFSNLTGNDDVQRVKTGPITVPGRWFDNSLYYFYALSPAPSVEQMLPGAPASILDARRLQSRDSVTSKRSNVWLAQCLYANSDYWNVRTQRGMSQWATQKWDSVLYPSQKGVVYLAAYYSAESGNDSVSTTLRREGSPVCWGDLSVSEPIIADLKPGVPNFFHYGSSPNQRLDSPGLPIAWTKDGVRGTDR